MKLTLGLSLLVLGTFSLTSCKINQEMDNKNDSTGLGGINQPAARNYTVSELEIARRICGNLKRKREFFGSLDNGKEQFKFRAELRNCDNGLYNSDLFFAVISNANSTDLEYIAARENYFRDVMTDQSGVMKQMCEAVTQTDNVMNTTYNGDFKYTVNFLIADGYDRFEISKSKKQNDGSYAPLSAEGVSVISQKIQAPTKFFGVEKERVRYIACDGKKFSTTKQTWVEAVTNF